MNTCSSQSLMPWFVPGGMLALRTSIRRLGGITVGLEIQWE